MCAFRRTQLHARSETGRKIEREGRAETHKSLHFDALCARRRRPRDARGGGGAMRTRRTPVLRRTSSKMWSTIASNTSSFHVWPRARAAGAMTFVHTRIGATAAAPPQQQAWPHALRIQDAPWQAWSHACACRTLPGKLGHMPSHAGRSLGQAWSHAIACRTLLPLYAGRSPEALCLATCRCIQDAP